MSNQFPEAQNGIDDLLGGGSPAPQPKPQQRTDELKFYSHSQIFYYWPIWITSLVFAVITYSSGTTFKAVGTNGKSLMLHGKPLVIKMVGSPTLGLIFLVIMLSVIFFTSVNLRGVWAAVFVLGIILFCLMMYSFAHDQWVKLLAAVGQLNIFMNFYFYLITGVAVFIAWLLTFWLFDRRRYILMRPTQITVVEEVAKGEKIFDTVGLVFDKKRDNFFQHLLLGFGSGDLLITTSGGQRMQIHFNNVMMINNRIQKIHELRERRGR